MKYLSDYEWLITLEQSNGRFPDWDIKMTYAKHYETVEDEIKTATYEVKSDRLSEQSGNFCIEFYNTKQEKPSGIVSSKADYYVYFADGKWRIAKRDELLVKLIQEQNKDIRDGGNNNSRMVILPVEKLPEYFQEIPELTEIPE